MIDQQINRVVNTADNTQMARFVEQALSKFRIFDSENASLRQQVAQLQKQVAQLQTNVNTVSGASLPVTTHEGLVVNVQLTSG